MFRATFKNLFILACVWALLGFILGTELLLGPVRIVTNICRSDPTFFGLEAPLVRTFILLLIAVSLSISVYITACIVKTAKNHVRFGLSVLLIACFSMTLFFWLNPEKFGRPLEADTNTDSEQFVVGSYPDEATLKNLKAQGFTAVISLLHPAVVPFEPKLIEDEKLAAARVGITLIQLPMLPWISENRESLARLSALAKSKQGKYYMHCYLGKDRVNVASRIIRQTGATGGSRTKARDLKNRTYLERGDVFMPEDKLYVIPYPTDEEYLSYIIAADFKTVVSLMPDDSEKNQTIIDREKNMLEMHGIKFIHFPVYSTPYDPENMMQIATSVKNMERPAVIHDFFSPSFRTEAFLQSFIYAIPSIPPSLLSNNLSVGKVNLMAPNVVAGQRPVSLEQFAELEKTGIATFLFLGDNSSREAVRDAQLTRVAQFDWRYFCKQDGNSDLTNMLASDGPWYIYGPGLDAAIPVLKAALPAPLPELKPPSPAQPIAVQKTSFLKKFLNSRKGTLTRHDSSNKISDFFFAVMPDVKQIILFGPFCLIYIFVCAAYAARLRVKRGVRAPYTRKIFHFLIFTMAGVLQMLAGLPVVALFGGIASLCVLYATYRGDGFPFYEVMARPTDAPHRTLYIIVPLITTALGGILANIFFTPFAYVGYFVGGWGDAIGEPVGSRWGRHKYRVPSMMGVPATRSIEGSTAVFLVSAAAAFLALMLGGISLETALRASLFCALAGTLVEAVSTHGLDNLTIQLAVSAVSYYYLRNII